jgi:PAS domain S-box-containing protein
MSHLHIPTLLAAMAAGSTLCAFLSILLWRQNRRRFRGLFHWAAFFFLETAGLVLIASRGRAPDWLSIVFANVLLLTGVMLAYSGFGLFVGRPVRLAWNWILLVAFAAAHAFFTYVRPDLTARGVNLSVAVLVVCVQFLRLIFRDTPPSLRRVTRIMGFGVLLFVLISVLRIAGSIAFPPSSGDYLAPDAVTAAAMILYESTSIFLVYGLILTVNGRLSLEMSLEQEKFSKFFNSSPDALLVSRLEDGRIIDVNDSFIRLSGYERSEAVGRTSINLQLWSPENRASVVDALAKDGRVQGMEFVFRTRSGAFKTCVFFSEIITLNDGQAIVSSVTDITDRKLAEDTVKRLLEEKEILLREVHHRIKNNLSTLRAMLTLQAGRQANPAVSDVLTDAADRLRSMSLLYDHLYQSATHNRASLQAYLTGLVNDISGSYPSLTPVRVDVRIEDILLEPGILSPLGIIVNEWMTNAMKYGFAGRQDNRIRIESSNRDGSVTLVFADNGIGRSVPDAPGPGARGFGLELVDLLVQQIGGTLSMDNAKGTTYTLKFTV